MPFSLRLIAKPVACRAKPRNDESRVKTLFILPKPPTRGRMSGVCRFGYSLFTVSKTGARDPRRRRKPFCFSDPPRIARAFAAWIPHLVEVSGIEPPTSCLQSRRSPN